MLNNKHWLPDVLAGAGIGILSVNLADLTHQNKWPFWKKKMNVMPTYSGILCWVVYELPIGQIKLSYEVVAD